MGQIMYVVLIEDELNKGWRVDSFWEGDDFADERAENIVSGKPNRAVVAQVRRTLFNEVERPIVRGDLWGIIQQVMEG